MSYLKNLHLVFTDDIDACTSWCDSTYEEMFGSYFEDQKVLFQRLQTDESPITDAELEQILMNVPLNLFTASEGLSKLKLAKDIIKLRSKDQDSVTKEESQLLISMYDMLIVRVERELSYSREMVMSAKKLWDARRSTDKVNPVSEPELPDYTDESFKTKSYIK